MKFRFCKIDETIEINFEFKEFSEFIKAIEPSEDDEIIIPEEFPRYKIELFKAILENEGEENYMKFGEIIEMGIINELIDFFKIDIEKLKEDFDYDCIETKLYHKFYIFPGGITHPTRKSRNFKIIVEDTNFMLDLHCELHSLPGEKNIIDNIENYRLIMPSDIPYKVLKLIGIPEKYCEYELQRDKFKMIDYLIEKLREIKKSKDKYCEEVSNKLFRLSESKPCDLSKIGIFFEISDGDFYIVYLVGEYDRANQLPSIRSNYRITNPIKFLNNLKIILTSIFEYPV